MKTILIAAVAFLCAHAFAFDLAPSFSEFVNPADVDLSQLGTHLQALQELADEYAEKQMKPEFDAIAARLNALHESANLIDRDTVVVDSEAKEAQKDQMRNWLASLPIDQMMAQTVAVDGIAKEINGSNLKPFEVALTFDDGPSGLYTPQIRQILKENGLGVEVAFFEVGQMIKNNPQLTRDLASDGHLIVNHSWSHPQLPKLTGDQVKAEINDTQVEIVKTLSDYNAYWQKLFARFFNFPVEMKAPQFFRSPYGAKNASTMAIINGTVAGISHEGGHAANLTLVHTMWNIDSMDWNDKNPDSIEARVFNELKMEKNHGIILMHDIHPQTVVAAKQIIARLKNEKYKFVSLYDVITE